MDCKDSRYREYRQEKAKKKALDWRAFDKISIGNQQFS
jgi:hypothetical protein